MQLPPRSSPELRSSSRLELRCELKQISCHKRYWHYFSKNLSIRFSQETAISSRNGRFFIADSGAPPTTSLHIESLSGISMLADGRSLPLISNNFEFVAYQHPQKNLSSFNSMQVFSLKLFKMLLNAVKYLKKTINWPLGESEKHGGYLRNSILA